MARLLRRCSGRRGSASSSLPLPREESDADIAAEAEGPFEAALNESWLLCVRQETKGSRPTGLRVGPHNIPVLYRQHHTPCRDWGRAYSGSLLHQNLSVAVLVLPDGAFSLDRPNATSAAGTDRPEPTRYISRGDDIIPSKAEPRTEP